MADAISMAAATEQPYRILSLDGGGAKGFYTLGVLREVEAMVATPLHERFDLIFGTSTGGIIAALLALGRSVDEIHELYKTHVPGIMRSSSRSDKSRALALAAEAIFGSLTFADVRTGVGIVATKWDLERPMIFKGDVRQAHGRSATFVPGFGCTIADAIQASASAYPFFDRKVITTSAGARLELVDGGYCANNPTLYAIADAIAALHVSRERIRVLSVGVGVYPSPKPTLQQRFFNSLLPVQLLQKTLEVNTQSMDQLRSLLFKDVQTIRISDTFEKPEMATDMFEHDVTKLNMLRQRGSESFASHEASLRVLLQ